MSKIYTAADQLIGHTPLLELTHIEKEQQLSAHVLAKLEYFNPAGSVKDRIAKKMIDDAEAKGLNMLYGPGNDLVSATAMTAAGAHMILFSTGRGTPFSAPAPTLKIATNTPLATKKSGWIDYNTGVIADGEKTIDETAQGLLELVIRVASGEQTKAEKHGFREISIFKDGVVL